MLTGPPPVKRDLAQVHCRAIHRDSPQDIGKEVLAKVSRGPKFLDVTTVDIDLKEPPAAFDFHARRSGRFNLCALHLHHGCARKMAEAQDLAVGFRNLDGLNVCR